MHIYIYRRTHIISGFFYRQHFNRPLLRRQWEVSLCSCVCINVYVSSFIRSFIKICYYTCQSQRAVVVCVFIPERRARRSDELSHTYKLYSHCIISQPYVDVFSDFFSTFFRIHKNDKNATRFYTGYC